MRALIRAHLYPKNYFNQLLNYGGAYDQAVRHLFRDMGYAPESNIPANYEEYMQHVPEDSTDPSDILRRHMQELINDIPDGIREREVQHIIMWGYTSRGQSLFLVTGVNATDIHIRVRGGLLGRLKHACEDINDRVRQLEFQRTRPVLFWLTTRLRALWGQWGTWPRSFTEEDFRSLAEETPAEEPLVAQPNLRSTSEPTLFQQVQLSGNNNTTAQSETATSTQATNRLPYVNPYLKLDPVILVIEPRRDTPTILGEIIRSARQEIIRRNGNELVIMAVTFVASAILFVFSPALAPSIANLVNAVLALLQSNIHHSSKYIEDALARTYSAFLVTFFITSVGVLIRLYTWWRTKPIRWSDTDIHAGAR